MMAGSGIPGVAMSRLPAKGTGRTRSIDWTGVLMIASRDAGAGIPATGIVVPGAITSLDTGVTSGARVRPVACGVMPEMSPAGVGM